MSRAVGVTGRIELIYLNTLRVVVLIVATAFILGAAFFAVDGLRRLMTNTEVPEAPTKVEPSEVLATVAVKKDTTGPGADTSAGASQADRKTYNAWKSGAFKTYQAAYVALAKQYNKREDAVLSVDQLADTLGYTFDAYQGGQDQSVKRFIDEPTYAAQLLATAAALKADNRVIGQLAKYRTAEKTAQSCSMENLPKRVWDENSMACSTWYLDPRGCAVIREVPTQVCVPSYPEGVTSPLQAFVQMDQGFRTLWAGRQTQHAEDATAERNKRTATKAMGLPFLVQAAKVFGAFLVAMFIFLVVAIERHLRRLAANSSEVPIAAAD